MSKSVKRFKLEINNAVSSHIKSVAVAKGYDSDQALLTYVNSTNPLWKSEANTFIAWRDVAWSYVYDQIALWEDEERTITDADELAGELDAIVWPTFGDAVAVAKTIRCEAVSVLRNEKLAAGRNNATLSRVMPSDSLDAGIAHIKRVRANDSADTGTRNISAITLGNPTVITATGNQFALGDRVYITGIVGPTELNGRAPMIIVDSGNSISVDFNSTGLDAYVSGGTVTAGMEFVDSTREFFGVTKAQMVELTADLTDYAEAVTLHAAYLKNQIDALLTTAAIEAFDITVGWPENPEL